MRNKSAQRILACLAVLILMPAAFSACGKQEDADGFNTGRWLRDEDHAKQLQYIAVYAKDLDGAPYFAADEEARQWILDTLAEVPFAPASLEAIHRQVMLDSLRSEYGATVDADAVRRLGPDFAFAMNEPYLFFTFTEEGTLLAKVPEDIVGHAYYEAAADCAQLPVLQARLEELRAAIAQKLH